MNGDDDDDKKGGGMTENTPIWIDPFANNQHDLKNAITADQDLPRPRKSPTTVLSLSCIKMEKHLQGSGIYLPYTLP